MTPSSTRSPTRAGVSARSVFRYFADVDDLASAAIARQQQRPRPAVGPRPSTPTVPLDRRIDRFVTARVAPARRPGRVGRVARVRATDQPLIRGRARPGPPRPAPARRRPCSPPSWRRSATTSPRRPRRHRRPHLLGGPRPLRHDQAPDRGEVASTTGPRPAPPAGPRPRPDQRRPSEGHHPPPRGDRRPGRRRAGRSSPGPSCSTTSSPASTTSGSTPTSAPSPPAHGAQPRRGRSSPTTPPAALPVPDHRRLLQGAPGEHRRPPARRRALPRLLRQRRRPRHHGHDPRRRHGGGARSLQRQLESREGPLVDAIAAAADHDHPADPHPLT